MFPLRVWPTVGHHSQMAPHLGVNKYTNWTRGEDTGGVQGGGVTLGAGVGGNEYKITNFMEFSKN